MKQTILLLISFFFLLSSKSQTASNGLTKVGNDFRLGGTLTQATQITLGTRNLWLKTNFNASEKWNLNNADGHVFIGDANTVPVSPSELPTSVEYLGRQNAAALIISKTKANNNENVDLFAMTTGDAASRNGWLFLNSSNSIGNVSPRMYTYSNASDATGYTHQLFAKSNSAQAAYKIILSDYDQLNINGQQIYSITSRDLFSIQNGYGCCGQPSYNLFKIDATGNWSGYAYANTDPNKVLTGDVNGNITFKTLTASDGSETKVVAGSNIVVTGTGTAASPYNISSIPNTNFPWQNSTIGTGNIINTNPGGVIIGNAVSSLPSGYKLYVADGILTEKVKVALRSSSNWADYVFSDGYKLRSLEETETYILKNKHLPGIQSATDIVNEGGIDVTDMLTKQMAKIEELTLHMIELNKKLTALEKENAEMKATISKTNK